MSYTAHQLNILRRCVVWVCVTALLLAFPLRVYAAESGKCGDRVKWSLTDGVLTLSGKGAMTDFTENTPAPWHDKVDDILSVVVKSGVTTVGSQSFYNCKNLQSVTLPDGITDIGSRAFKDCTALGYISLNTGLKTIGEAAFESCEALSGIVLPQGLNRIENYAFYCCYSLQSITVPKTVTYLGLVSFANCTALVRADIQCEISQVPEWLFYGCEKLTTVCLPSSVSTVGTDALHGCNAINLIYYNGASSDALRAGIAQGVGENHYYEILNPADYKNSATGNSSDEQGGTAVVTDITESENAVIATEVETEYTFSVDGVTATAEQAAAAAAGGSEISVESSKATTITATVQNSDGWTEVTEAVSEALRNRQSQDDQTVEVAVQLNDNTVSSADLSKTAGKAVTLTVKTANGGQWKIDQSSNGESDYKKDSYDLGVTVTKLEDGKKGIESDTVYQVQFSGSTDFDATVGVNVNVGNAYQYATLYRKKGTSLKEVETVLVDADGNAWFHMTEGVKKNAKYYVGVNVEGVDTDEATIPATLYDEYDIDKTSHLTDAAGNAYEISGNKTFLGMTGKKFAIVAAIVIGGIVLIVTLIMITINKIAKSKAKYKPRPVEEFTDDYVPLDEDALRLQIMQEMLEEAQQKNKSKDES